MILDILESDNILDILLERRRVRKRAIRKTTGKRRQANIVAKRKRKPKEKQAAAMRKRVAKDKRRKVVWRDNKPVIVQTDTYGRVKK